MSSLIKVVFSLAICLLFFSLFSIIFEHFGFSLKILTIAYWILALGTFLYLLDIKRTKDKELPFELEDSSAKKEKLPVISLIISLIGVYWSFFLSGPRVANDFSLVSQATLKSLMDYPRVWMERGAEGLGEYTIFTLWSWPYNLIIGVFANLGLNFEILERVFLLIPILVLGGLGIWKVGKKFNLSDLSCSVSTFLYLTNTYILLLIDGGQLSIALVYALLPLCFLSIEKALHGKISLSIIAGFIVSILSFFDIRVTFIIFLLSFIYFVYEFFFTRLKKEWLSKGLKTGLIIGIIFLGIHSFWLLSFYKSPLSSENYQVLTQSLSTNLVNIGHSLSLLSPHWYKNVFGNITQVRWEFILLTILVFSAPILKPRSKIVGFWLLVSVIFIFLGKGNSAPFPQFYNWLFSNVLPFSLFRDSTKFFFLIALAYSILIGSFFNEIFKFFKGNKIIKNAIFLGIISYLFILAYPAWTQTFSGTFSKQPRSEEYLFLEKLLKNDEEFSRIFWIPSVAPLGYSDPTHPWVEASRFYKRRPFVTGVIGNYELFNFLREAPYMGQLFDVSGIGYIVYPFLDIRRDNWHTDDVNYYFTFSNQLSKLSWVETIKGLPLTILKTKTHQDRFFLPSNTWLVIGSDGIYNEATKSAKLNLNNNAMIFVEENKDLIRQGLEMPSSKIALYKKTPIDLAANLIKSEEFIFPAESLNYSPNQSGWWKRDRSGLIPFRDFLQSKYNVDNKDFDLSGGWAIGEGNVEIKIKNPKLKKDKVLLARVFESSRSGQLKFFQNENLIGTISTLKNNNNVRWFEIGDLKESNDLVIQASGDINIINALAVLNRSEWITYQNEVEELINNKRVMDFREENTEQNFATVKYQKISDTKYKVSVDNLSKPQLLVFSSTFHPSWKINGESSPLPIYSMLNGFILEKNGEYIIEFEIQKYIYPGLLVSFLVISASLIFMIAQHKRK